MPVYNFQDQKCTGVYASFITFVNKDLGYV
jgi:hypothetical protein